MNWTKTIFFFLIFYGSVSHSYPQGKIISDFPYYNSFDQIHYVAFTGPTPGSDSPLYYAVELIDSHGKDWIQQKLKVNEGFLSGTMNLQSHIPTGYYWIRAYPALFTHGSDPVLYLPIIILNADDLEEDHWKEIVLGNKDKNKIVLIEGNADKPGAEQPINFAILNENGRIIPGSGYYRGIQPESMKDIKSDIKGLFQLPGTLKSSPEIQIVIGLNQSDTLKTTIGNLFNENNKQSFFIVNLEPEQRKTPINIKIIKDKESYNPGEIVKLKISATGSNSAAHGRMIVIAYDASQLIGMPDPGDIKTYSLLSRNASENYSAITSSANPQGYLLKAKYINPANGKPRTNYAVSLICLGSKPSLSITSADKSGSTHFNVSDIPENSTFYISTIEQPIEGLSVEDDYFRNFTETPLIYFDPSYFPALDSFVNVSKIRRILYFQYFEKKREKPVTAEQLLFDSTNVYGTPDISYNLNDYIQFSSMQEVISEILPNVHLKNTKKGPKITIINNKNPYLNRNPIFLINGIPTRNVPFILSQSTQDVQKIDLLYELKTLQPYGLAGFGGIMAIYTSRPVVVPNVEKINFKGIHNSPPEFSASFQQGLPDLSPVVYWNSAELPEAGTYELQFKLNDLLSDIKVEVIGFDSKGQMWITSTILKINEILESNDR